LGIAQVEVAFFSKLIIVEAAPGFARALSFHISVQHHPGAQGATPPHLRRGAFKNSPPDSGGVAL